MTVYGMLASSEDIQNACELRHRVESSSKETREDA